MSAEPGGHTLLVMIVTISKYKNGCSNRHATLRTDGQWFYDDAIKFVRWQHPAIGAGRNFLCLALLVLFT